MWLCCKLQHPWLIYHYILYKLWFLNKKSKCGYYCVNMWHRLQKGHAHPKKLPWTVYNNSKGHMIAKIACLVFGFVAQSHSISVEFLGCASPFCILCFSIVGLGINRDSTFKFLWYIESKRRWKITGYNQMSDNGVNKTMWCAWKITFSFKWLTITKKIEFWMGIIAQTILMWITGVK